MVTIHVAKLVNGADTVEQGGRVASAISDALTASDIVTVSFAGIGAASSSFVSAAIIPVLTSVTFPEFKRRVRIVGASWQIVDVIKRRVSLAVEAA
jgi:hypothetical protein